LKQNTVWELGGHHRPAVNLAPVDNERAIANGVNHALLFAFGINACGNSLQHNNVVLFNDIDDLALYVGEALLD
jgi:hypothetical protein